MIQVRCGSPDDLHALDPFGASVDRVTPVQGLEVWRCEPDSAAVVLGSRQAEGVVDHAACRRAGIGVAKRRSGGGAVLVVPDDIVWIDVIASRGWLPDDVRGSIQATSQYTVAGWWFRTGLHWSASPGWGRAK